MEACNQYCESILHFAARKASLDMVQFMLSHGARCFVDDAGRLPMHDVCWRARPAFDIVSLLLNHDLSMLLVQDRFGAVPLDYVNSRQWKEWRRYLDSIKDQYWPVQSSESSGSDSNDTEEREKLKQEQDEEDDDDEGAYPETKTNDLFPAESDFELSLLPP